MTVRTRFAPSPTGALHIGSARTALFNWLFTRHMKGEFLLRIEDTDRTRSSDENVKIILDSMEWLGLDYDGEPIFQFARAARHAEIAKELVAKGEAYYCYTTQEELQTMREEAEKEGKHFRYPGIWRDKPASQAPKGIPPVIRIKAPLEGESIVKDAVQGDVKVSNQELDDFVILRADGTPTYLLSVVVDDYDMDITHVIRGDDHLTNTFRQKIIFDSMGWDLPIYAHIPLIHGMDGKKMSKRHGATGVDDYKALGILPEAMCNYLMKLGWGHGDEEIIPQDLAIELFTLDGIGRAPAKFDLDKLRSINAHYIKETDNDALATAILPLIEKSMPVSDQSRIWILKGMEDMKDRAKDLNELAETAKLYVYQSPISYDEKAAGFITKDHIETLKRLKDGFETLTPFTMAAIEEKCKIIAERDQIGMKNVMMPLRAAVVGTTVTPHLAKMLEIFGAEEVCLRLNDAINKNS